MRGYYGQALLGAPAPARAVEVDRPLDYGTTGAALGIGVLLGIVVGSKMTFHSPVRVRR
jgi:hypothetical protein